ncbi:MAG: response regulator [Dysgonamonadaceae bacterium]|jgi:signal transduction histidine kinase/ligand-binding sensor domain-containing protein/DNA-binding response OmpR family regulator|nr:response regulator [Dysgonamonadaceae bacterium]
MNKQPEIIKLWTFFILSLLSMTSISARQTRYGFHYITNNNELTHNTVYDICQDEKGFMWFSTETGLNRYDGLNIKQYHHVQGNDHSLPSRVVSCLVYTSDNKLFAGTDNGLALYHPETDDFEHLFFNGKTFFTAILAMVQGYEHELLITAGSEGAFRYNYKTGTISRFEIKEKIFGLAIDHENTYWAFSRNNLYRFNKDRKQIATYRVSAQLFGSAISCIKADKQGILWVGTFDNGLFTFDSETNQFRQISLCKEAKMYYVRTIEESGFPNEYWVGTENGLYIINTKTNDCEHYMQSFDEKHKTLNDNAVYKIYRSRQGIFFIGTYFGGINIANTNRIGFNAVLPDDRPGHLHGKAINMMAKAPGGDLWIATEDAGIAIFDRNKYAFRHLLFNEKDPNSISSNNIHALLMDGESCWVGHFMGGISKYDMATGKVKHFIGKAGNNRTLSNNFVFALYSLSPDSLLVGTLSGVNLLDKRTETFSSFRENEFAACFVYDIFTAPDGKIWFCTYNQGIYVLDTANAGLMTHFQAGDDSGLPGNSIISHCIDSQKQIWIGTRGNGLLKYQASERRFEQCKPDMFVDNVIYGILEEDGDDGHGHLWISTNKGISRLNFKDSTAVHFNVKHGIAGNQHNYKSYYKENGIFYFGSVSGFTCFDPKTIVIPREVPSVYFTNLRIFNEIVRPDSNGLLQQQIDFTRYLTLRHNQNSFTFDYASIDYFSNDIAYQYYLEGFEDSWSSLTHQTQANYTNIAPGNYLFRIRAINTISNSISEERILQITIKRPFWAAWYAYLLYAALLWGTAYYLYRNYRNRQREKMTLVIEKVEKENLKLLHQHKMNFFTYISHEFKTPLSIIVASVEMLAQKNNPKEENEIQESIKRSATRLLYLVNQLMEFRKIETDHAVIHITKGDVIDFSNRVINVYRPLLDKKGIKVNISVSYTETEVFFDFDKLEKIMTNLFTNAIKYTPNNGTIDFMLNVDPKTIRFSVRDSGNGIPERKKDKIFEVFYSDEFSNDVMKSSGIGLALTASLVKLLKGEITIDSQPGKGSLFSVTLPHTATATALPPADLPPASTTILPTDTATATATAENESLPEKKKEYTLVIAEDNKDLLMLLHKNFKEKYHVKCFENGHEAWEYISRKNPDILLTDIMMPVMSGIELCEKIKTDINLCHIPVVMLTAKDTKEAKLEGLQVGADAYIAKPFSMAELEIRISNILKNQKALKKRLKELAGFEGFDLPSNNQEQAFVEKILAVIQSNIEKSELDVSFIADTLHISRSSLHNRMKILMNMNPSEFITTVRINKAKELILRKDLTFSEIAYRVGYNDSAYFTRIFKKHTGTTPKEYKSGTAPD